MSQSPFQDNNYSLEQPSPSSSSASAASSNAREGEAGSGVPPNVVLPWDDESEVPLLLTGADCLFRHQSADSQRTMTPSRFTTGFPRSVTTDGGVAQQGSGSKLANFLCSSRQSNSPLRSRWKEQSQQQALQKGGAPPLTPTMGGGAASRVAGRYSIFFPRQSLLSSFLSRTAPSPRTLLVNRRASCIDSSANGDIFNHAAEMAGYEELFGECLNEHPLPLPPPNHQISEQTSNKNHAASATNLSRRVVPTAINLKSLQKLRSPTLSGSNPGSPVQNSANSLASTSTPQSPLGGGADSHFGSDTIHSSNSHYSTPGRTMNSPPTNAEGPWVGLDYYHPQSPTSSSLTLAQRNNSNSTRSNPSVS